MSTPYAGNPANFPVTVTTLVDGVDAPTFVNIESAVQANRDALVYLAASAAQDWRSQFNAGTLQGPSATPTLAVFNGAAYDPINRVWLAGGSDGSGKDALFTSIGIDDGNAGVPGTGLGPAWAFVGSNAVTITEQMAVLADEGVGGRYWTAIAPNGGGVQMHSWVGGSSTLQHTFVPAGTLFPQLLYFNNRIILAIGSSTAASVSINSTASATPATWTGNLSPGIAISTWFLKTDKVWPGAGSIAIAMPGFSFNTVTPNYWTSTDGQTWTSRSFSTLLANTTDEVVGLCFSPARSLWYCVVRLTAGTGLKVFTSPDGITWTGVTMVSTLYSDAAIVDVAPLGTMLLATVADVGLTGCRFLLSPDGGATWYLIAANFSTSFASGGSQYIRPQFAVGNNGLLAFNNEWARFSRFLGLPGVPQ